MKILPASLRTCSTAVRLIWSYVSDDLWRTQCAKRLKAQLCLEPELHITPEQAGLLHTLVIPVIVRPAVILEIPVGGDYHIMSSSPGDCVFWPLATDLASLWCITVLPTCLRVWKGASATQKAPGMRERNGYPQMIWEFTALVLFICLWQSGLLKKEVILHTPTSTRALVYRESVISSPSSHWRRYCSPGLKGADYGYVIDVATASNDLNQADLAILLAEHLLRAIAHHVSKIYPAERDGKHDGATRDIITSTFLEYTSSGRASLNMCRMLKNRRDFMARHACTFALIPPKRAQIDKTGVGDLLIYHAHSHVIETYFKSSYHTHSTIGGNSVGHHRDLIRNCFRRNQHIETKHECSVTREAPICSELLVRVIGTGLRFGALSFHVEILAIFGSSTKKEISTSKRDYLPHGTETTLREILTHYILRYQLWGHPLLSLDRAVVMLGGSYRLLPSEETNTGHKYRVVRPAAHG